MNNIKRNYQKELEAVLKKLPKEEEKVPTLLLHSCCAPCSSYCLEYLSDYFEITIFYFNPNIYPEEEYRKRVEEQKRLAKELPARHPIHVIEGTYEPKQFYEAVKGLEKILEGGERCFACFALRLKEAARLASERDFDFFTTTLTISPLKNAAKINEIGEQCPKECNAVWLPTDFKKKEGYKRSIELSAEYGLYRQDYCDCVFSQREREEQNKTAAEKAGRKVD